MRIAIAQINSALTDFKKNHDKIIEFTNKAKDHGCDLVVFPECALFGYHPFDLLAQKKFITEQNKYFKKIQNQIPKEINVVFGLFTENKKSTGRPYFNSAVLLNKKTKPRFFNKQLLPTGDVFDEGRYIEPGSIENNLIKINGKNTLITICEDIWAWEDGKNRNYHTVNPLKKFKGQKIDLIVNMSASPFYLGKSKEREFVVSQTAKNLKAPVVYVNMVGSQDEIVFDGGSLVVNNKGQTLLELPHFEEAFTYFELDQPKKMTHRKVSEIEQIRKAIVLSIRDFCEKNSITKVHFGLSGGIDSAVIACLATDAIGPANVKALAMPTQFNVKSSYDLALKLSHNLGIEMISFPISSTYEKIKSEVDEVLNIKSFSLVHENIQARLRGLILMAYSNHQGSLLINTSNKSEFAVGYSTLYGDMCGGLSPIGDLTKKQVYDLANLYNKDIEIVPSEIITRAPSAELRPNQKDQDSLPDYDLLDSAVNDLVTFEKVAKTDLQKWTQEKLFKSEFKRWQSPPITKISRRAFGKGRRWPISFKS